MKRLASWGWLLVFSSITSTFVMAQTGGTASYTFLNIPVGARATGMGEAFASVPNDVQALVYNPASLATLVASQISFEHLSYLANTTQEAVAFGHAGRQEGFSWGYSANYLRVGDITRTLTNPSDTSGNGFTEAGSFSTYDLALGASAAGPVTDTLVVGSTVKLVRESLGDAKASAAAVDLGGIYQLSEQRSCNLGAVVQNVGYSTKFADAAVKLPLTFRLGISGQPFAQWLLTGDFVKPLNTDGQFNVGAEVTPQHVLSLRAGYQYALHRPDLGGFANFSLGLGLRFERMSFDYAFLPLGDLGTTHRISVNYRFRPPFDDSVPPVLRAPAVPEAAPALQPPPSPKTPASVEPAPTQPDAGEEDDQAAPASDVQANPKESPDDGSLGSEAAPAPSSTTVPQP